MTKPADSERIAKAREQRVKAFVGIVLKEVTKEVLAAAQP